MPSTQEGAEHLADRARHPRNQRRRTHRNRPAQHRDPRRPHHAGSERALANPVIAEIVAKPAVELPGAGTGAVTILLTLLGTVSLSRDLRARAAADPRWYRGPGGLPVLSGLVPVPRPVRRGGTVPAWWPGAAWPPITLHAAGRVRLTCAFSSSRIISPPETGAPQARLSALARAWAADGDTVTVLTGIPNYPTGAIPPEYRGAIRRREGETVTGCCGPGCTPHRTRAWPARPSATSASW